MKAMAWLTWRQDRWVIGFVALVALVGAYALISIDLSKAEPATLPLGGFYGLILQMSFGGLVGMFWGAPLIGRELEERTYFVAWGQDVTPVRWLHGKLVVFLPVAVVLAVLLGLGDGYTGPDNLSWSTFEANSFVQVGYVVMGLGIGVLAGLVTRHVFTAIAMTLVAFAGVRLVLSFSRDYYLPPQRAIVTSDQTVNLPRGAATLAEGFVNAELEPVDVNAQCEQVRGVSDCLRSVRATAGMYVDYQPVERVGLFRFFEFGICTLAGAGALAVTFLLLRRGGGWRPSRAHRRDVVQNLAPVRGAQSTSS